MNWSVSLSLRLLISYLLLECAKHLSNHSHKVQVHKLINEKLHGIFCVLTLLETNLILGMSNKTLLLAIEYGVYHVLLETNLSLAMSSNFITGYRIWSISCLARNKPFLGHV